MRPRWQRTARREAQSVDVTAFLSLMVILVPFLLITAVFSRTAILEIQSAIGEEQGARAEDALQLQVIVRRAAIEVSYVGQTGPLRIDRSDDSNWLQSLAILARQLKAQHPQSINATVLLEPQISYDVLVRVLDALRVSFQFSEGTHREEALFPVIALGSAPAGEKQG